MDIGITREEALALLHQYIENQNMVKHCLATEAVMRALADDLGEDADQWAMAGLLHDLDVELVNADLSVHGLETEKILREKGVHESIIEAIKLHNEKAHDQKRSTPFHHALAAGETITGLVIATALVYPDKKIKSVKPKSIVKRMKEKSFAAGVDRSIVMECEKIGYDINRFAALCLQAMQSIDAELGL
jgi:putative nucleotidyltransferase with HDIG domain